MKPEDVVLSFRGMKIEGLAKGTHIVQPAERPIIFSGWKVCAILEGRGTVTRRVIKKTPPQSRCDTCWNDAYDGGYHGGCNSQTERYHQLLDERASRPCWALPCLYGRPGDRLWVRETWAPARNGDTGDTIAIFRSDWASNGKPEGPLHQGFRWKPSIHMPRWASRLLLEVVDVRAERLQEITDDDCFLEGIDGEHAEGHGYVALGPDGGYWRIKEVFADLWDSLNIKRGFSWESNPWVWRVEFRRLDA